MPPCQSQISLRKRPRGKCELSFTKFIAPSIAKIVYILVMVVIAIAYLLFVVAGFQQSSLLGFLVLLIIGPVFGLLYLVLARVGLESLIASIRTAENTSELVRRAGNPGSGSEYRPNYPQSGPDSTI